MLIPQINRTVKNTKLNPGQTRSVVSTYPKKRIRKPDRRKYSFDEYGYINSDGDEIPKEYLVRISSYRLRTVVIAPMQEAISMNVESQWEPLVPTSLLRTAQAPVQFLTQILRGEARTPITSATSRRIWTGTSPMVISLKLKFEAVQDPYREVVEPCRILQTMAAPSDPTTDRDHKGIIENARSLDPKIVANTIASFPALQPPGPTPFTWDNLIGGQVNYADKSREDIEKSAKGGDFIIIEFGTFLTFWNVIIRESGVEYDIKFTEEGYPISAHAAVTFETYEMPTKESLKFSYKKTVPNEPTSESSSIVHKNSSKVLE